MTAFDPSSLKYWEFVADVGEWLVIIGVAGEGVELIVKCCEIGLKRKQRWRHFFHKADPWINLIGGIFWMMVVVGLYVGFKGNHKAKIIVDRDNAELHKQAESERIRANTMELNLRELAHVYGQSSNALVEATNILQQANGQLASAEAKLAEARAMIRPLKDRVIQLLNEIDPKILVELQSGKTSFAEQIPTHLYSRLASLSAEPDFRRYMFVKVDPTMTIVMGKGQVFNVTLEINPVLLK